MNVNVKSVLNVSQVVAKKMIDAKSGGSIVNISSQASKVNLCFCSVTFDKISTNMYLLTHVSLEYVGIYSLFSGLTPPSRKLKTKFFYS